MSAITMTAPQGLESLNEAQWQALVVEAALYYGWWTIHHRNALGNPMWVDLLLLRAGTYLLLELKRMNGRVTPKQQALHQELLVRDIVVWVLRPCERDWRVLTGLLQ